MRAPAAAPRPNPNPDPNPNPNPNPNPSQVIPSSDGKHLVLLGASGSLLLLSAKTKQLVATLQPGSGGFGCQCAAFSPGAELLYAAGAGGKVQVWDVARRYPYPYPYP